ncbi:MAG: NUDIX hydrolase [Aggregatilineales bacterium]
MGELTEKIVHTERVFSGVLVKLDVHDVELPDGSMCKREVIQHPGASAVIALDGDDVILVKQFRSASAQFMLELPAGVLEVDEAPEVCAIRELQEEIGYKPGKLESIGGFYNAPGYTTEYIHLYIATNLIESRLQGDIDEQIEVVRLPLSEALTMIENGTIADSKTIIGLLRLARRLGV